MSSESKNFLKLFNNKAPKMEVTEEEQWTIDAKGASNCCLFSSVSMGLINRVEELVKKKKRDVNAKNKEGWTPLMYAAFCDHVEILKLLLHHGAKCNLQNNEGRSALILAATAGHREIVEILLKESSICDLRDARGWSALFYAAQNGFDDILRFLLTKGVEINYQEKEFGYTALMIASIEGNQRISTLLMNAGADCTKKCFAGNTAQSLAVLNGHTDLARQLGGFPVQENTVLKPTVSVKVEDLKGVLEMHGLNKYYENFEEQEIDLAIFLTLTEEDLFELGIKTFGPRRQLLNLIDRYVSNIPFSSEIEQAYANKMSNTVKNMEAKLEKARSEIDALKLQVASLKHETNASSFPRIRKC